MRIDYATADDIRTVALAMRQPDFDEFVALAQTDDRIELADVLAARYAGRPDVMVAFWEAQPVAVGGLVENRPHVLTALFFATDAFPQIALEVSYTVARMLRDIKASDVHRIEAVSLVGHDEAHRWIRHFGLQPEGSPMRGYGKNGEAYQQFAWVKDACAPSA